MSKSGSRYGRRSNWFKIHCLLQEQTGMDGPMGNTHNGAVSAEDLNSMLALHANGKHHHHHHHRSRHTEQSSSSPEGTGSDFIKEEMVGGPMEMADRGRLSSSSSVASGRSDSPMDEDELSSKEHLRLLMSGSRTPDSPHYHRFSRSNKSSTARDSISPKPGLLAFAQQQQHSIGLPVRTSSPKLPESSSSGRRGLIFPSATSAASALFQQHLLAPHPLYQQLYAQQQPQQRIRSASPVDSLPEQENPIDLSCKSSSSSPRPLCHIRAEILTDLHHDDDDSITMAGQDGHREGDTAAPLDLTTKG